MMNRRYGPVVNERLRRLSLKFMTFQRVASLFGVLLVLHLQIISFCLPPGSYRLTLAIFSDGEGHQEIYQISLGSQCENYTVSDVSQSKISLSCLYLC